MFASCQTMIRARALLAPWLMIFLLMRTVAAEVDLASSTNTVAIVPQLSEVQDAAPAEVETANEKSGPSETVAATVPEPKSDRVAPQTVPERKIENPSR